MDEDWKRYYEATKEGPAHRLFDLLEPHLPPKGRAIDLGCGTGRGTLRLLAAGLDVTAVDASQEALAAVRAKVPEGGRLTLVQSSFEDLELDRYDVAVGCFSLFFLSPEAHARFWPRLVDAIEPGGLWAGHFLGVRDEWRARGYATHERTAIEELLTPFEVFHLEEEEKDGQTAIGTPKHWHVFHTVARKR